MQAQIEILERYKEARSGVLGRMDDEMVNRVLQYLNRGDILNLRLVSKRYDRLATLPAVWRPLCKELESTWDGMIDLSNYQLEDDGDWYVQIEGGADAKAWTVQASVAAREAVDQWFGAVPGRAQRTQELRHVPPPRWRDAHQWLVRRYVSG